MSLSATLGSWEHVLATNQGTIDLQNRAKDVLGAFQQRSNGSLKVSSSFPFDALQQVKYIGADWERWDHLRG